ncbi:MAG: ABC transporter permease [Candidatus Saccharibacteria bacterium]
MKTIDLLQRAARSLKSAKARTILTSLAIAVGAFTLTVTLSAGNGIRAYTDRLIANNFDPAESIVGRDKEIEDRAASTAPKEYSESIGNLTVGAQAGSLQIKQITDKDIAQLKTFPFVEQVRPNYQLSVRYITREGQKKYTLSAQAYNPGQKPEVEAGSLPTADITKGEVLLPSDYISLLGFKDANDAIGKNIELNIQQPFSESSAADYVAKLQAGLVTASADSAASTQQTETVPLKVKAVTKPGAAALSISGQPVVVGDADAKELYDYTTKGTSQYGKYIYAYVRVKDGANVNSANTAKATLKAQGFTVQTSQDVQQTITQFINILQILVGVFGVITVIASVFGIINTMYISVLERTREIGLMKALGMRGRDVSWLFRLEAAWIGFLGGAIGAGTAFVLGISLNPWLTKTLNLGEGNSILIFNGLQIAALIVILIFVAIIAGWLPARKAAKLDPIEALRTE